MCDCGDIYCRYCGPAQGNGYCPCCGGWASDGGCEDPTLCRLHCEVQDAGEYAYLAEDAPDHEEAIRAAIGLSAAKSRLATYERALILGGHVSKPEPGGVYTPSAWEEECDPEEGWPGYRAYPTGYSDYVGDLIGG